MSEIQVLRRNMQQECSELRQKSPTICKLHSRDFSDCFRFHKQHPFWEKQHPFQARSTPPTHLGVQSTLKELTLNMNRAIQLRDITNLKRRSPESELQSDPMRTLGPDIMEMVFMRLDACSLARSGSASKLWKSLAHSDALWIPKCEDLWLGKQNITPQALLPGLSRLAAYGISLKDSRRCFITMDDLCGTIWEFRFKDNVPQYWMELDPSKHGEPPMQRFFHRDSSHTAPVNDPVWGGHESSFTIIETPEPKPGTSVRINSWPEMMVSRTPNWGWQLQNNFYVYTSLPPPPLAP